MSSAQLKMMIVAKQSDLDKTQVALETPNSHMNYLITVFEQEIYELNVRLQLAEADETFVPDERFATTWELEQKDDPCYHCGRANHSCICASEPAETLQDIWGGEEPALAAAATPFYPPRTERTKLKWVLNPETYRVAVATKDGILEVKNVSDGSGDCHNYKVCACLPCKEVRISGGRLPPWRKGLPLVKTIYDTEAAWRESLPEGGTITVTDPRPSNKALKALSMAPLESTTDSLKLKELEERFPGATMVLTTKDQHYEVRYQYNPVYGNIRCDDAHISAPCFAFFGDKKPSLMAEWRGLYIDLSHLF